jgi:hypothetical protein
VRAGIVAVAIAGCGRYGFAPGDADAGGDTGPMADAFVCHPIGHDEDGDGVDDACDVCPHLADDQTDSDGDRIGDACDPEPANPRQHLVLFATMRPGDQPLATGGQTWTQNADSIRFDGTGYGGLRYTMNVQNTVFAMGFDIHAAIGTGVQHQISLAMLTPATSFVSTQFNQSPANSFTNAEISYYDGTTYTILGIQQLANNIHAGTMTLQGTWVVGTSVDLAGGWPGEPYQLHADTAMYPGGAIYFQLDSNNVDYDCTWVWLVGW